MSMHPTSIDQLTLAKALGLDVAHDSFEIAAARIFDAVAPAIGQRPAEVSTERQREFANSLGIDVLADTKRIASAKIGEALYKKGQDALAEMNLRPGDQVIRFAQFEFQGEAQVIEEEFVVSSIQKNGRVFFKGGNGQSAWPTQLRKRVG